MRRMNAALLEKLHGLLVKKQGIERRMASQEAIETPDLLRDLGRDHAKLSKILALRDRFQVLNDKCREDQKLVTDEREDEEIRVIAMEEVAKYEKDIRDTERDMYRLLLPQDAYDDRNIYLEIRAGTGGEEASIFAKDLFRMYVRYAETQRWELDIIHSRESEKEGFKEVVAKLTGKNVYAKMKFESGAHRVQRVPRTESQGRIHTSAATVAILPEAGRVEEVSIQPSDLRIDTYKASGAGGQHVNKTDSAVRITHIPSGVTVECQDQRSQHKNKARAMELLQAKLLDAAHRKQLEAECSLRRNLVGSGDRSDRIRTYNFPQRRVTDHRINLTLYSLPQFMEGEIDEVISALHYERMVVKAEQMFC